MDRSHSRHSYPSDKSLPLRLFRSYTAWLAGESAVSSTVRRAKKDMHKVKRRQRDAQLVRDAMRGAVS